MLRGRDRVLWGRDRALWGRGGRGMGVHDGTDLCIITFFCLANTRRWVSDLLGAST